MMDEIIAETSQSDVRVFVSTRYYSRFIPYHILLG